MQDVEAKSNIITRESSHLVCVYGALIGAYTCVNALGRGRFATVYTARRQGENTTVAIKVFRHGDHMSDYTHEVKMLNKLGRSTNCIQIYGTFVHVDTSNHKPRIHPCIVLELNGIPLSTCLDLWDIYHTSGLSMSMVKHITRSIFNGLAHAHSVSIVHSDIKPGNILFDCTYDEFIHGKQPTVKLADFGSSEHTGDRIRNHVSTYGYTAPETLIRKLWGRFRPSIDIWSAACTVFELITGTIMFDIFGDMRTWYGDITYREISECGSECGSECNDKRGEHDPNDTVHNTSDETPIIIKKSVADKIRRLFRRGQKNVPSLDDSSIDECGIDKSYHVSRDTDCSSGSCDGLSDDEIATRTLTLITKIIGIGPKKYSSYVPNTLQPMSIYELIMTNTDIQKSDARHAAKFLKTLMTWSPNDRPTAAAVLTHKWLR